MAGGELDSLIIRLAAETADAQRQLGRMERNVGKFSRNAERELSNVDRAFASLGGAARKAAGAIGAAFIGIGLASFIDEIARANNSMADLSDSVGLTYVQMQQLRTLMLDQGMSVEEFERAMRRFAVAMGEARGRSGGFYEFLRNHLPTVAEQISKTKTQAEALRLLEDVFERLPNASHRAALANAAFGRTGLQLAAILNQAGSQMDRAKQVAKDYGTVVSDEAIAATREYQRNIDLATQKMRAMITEGLGQSLIWMRKFAEENKATGQAISSTWNEALGILVRVKAAVDSLIAKFIELNKTALQQAQGMIAGFGLWVRDNTLLKSWLGDKEKFSRDLKDAIALAQTELEAARQMAQGKLTGTIKDTVAAGQKALGEWKTQVDKSPLEWKVKLRPEDKMGKWRVTVTKGDPFAELYEKAFQAQARYEREVRSSFKGLERLIQQSIADPLADAFDGSLKSGKEYIRQMLSGFSQLITKVLILDPLVKGITNTLSSGGKSSFNSVLNSLFTNLLGGFQFKAAGGPVTTGTPYIVGERGPELIVPKTNGNIMSAASLRGASGGQSVVYNIDARGAAPGVEQRVYQAIAELERRRPSAPQAITTYGQRFPLRGAA